MRGAGFAVAACVLLWTLTGCGGGGSGGGGGPSVPNGAFTISATSASFVARQNGASPASQSLTITITGQNAAYAGAAYPQGQGPPGWLGFNITGSGTVYQLVLTITSTAMPPGQYTTTFGVGTADSGGNILQSQYVTVNYTVNGSVAITSSSYSGAFTYGGSPTSAAVPVTVNATGGVQWAAASDSPWLSVPPGGQTGQGAVQATVNTAGLIPGSYLGHVTVVDGADSTDSASMTFSITVQQPTVTALQDSLLLGGSDGLSTSTPQNINFSVNTGAVAHPFAVTVSTSSGGNWLGSTTTSGMVDSNGVTIQISGDRTGLVGGTYTGQVQLAVTVGTLVVTQNIPVTFNVEANRIVVGASGVGFLSSPGGSVLTRDVMVFSTIGRTDTPWQASSDQPWLSVTGSGVTGATVTLTAVPTGLSTNTTHFANVTVKSSDTTVENQETIRVGLYVSTTAPSAVSQSVPEQFVATSPVEPIAFVNNGGTDVEGYNVYTGAVDRTFTAVTSAAGPMTVSADGTRLYVYDQSNVVELDVTTGAIQHSYPSNGTGTALAYIRPNAYSMLITSTERLFDVSTHAQFDSAALPVNMVSLAGSPDSSKIVTDPGHVFSIVRSAVGGGQLLITSLFGSDYPPGSAGQACISADGQTVYTASGFPNNFPGISITTQLQTQTLPAQPYPNSIECVWNGVIVGGTDGYTAATDVFVYNGPTGAQLALLASSATGHRDLVARGMAVSADATRLVTVVSPNLRGTTGDELRFQGLPAPP
jgi:hypothetical protein